MNAAAPLASLAEAVRKATQDLILATSRSEADAIEQAIDQRAMAVADLESMLRETPGDSKEADDLRANLALQAAEAEEALRRLIEESGGRLRALSGKGLGVRGYARHSRESSALDRSG